MVNYIAAKRENFNLIEQQKVERKINLAGFPYWLTADPSSCCNLRCPLCPTGQQRNSRKSENLSFELYSSVLERLGPYLIHIDLCNWGEPLMNPRIYEMIKLAKSYFVDVKLDTNLNLLDERGAESLIDAGPDKILLSIDGASQETYEIYRQGGDIKKVLENIRILVRKKEESGSKKPVIEWQFLVFRHNQHEIEAAKKIARDLGVSEINFTPPYAGSLEWLTTLSPFREKYYEVRGDGVRFKEQGREKICNWLWDALALNSGGSVSACCSVEDAQDDFFSVVPEGGLSDLWNDEKYIKARSRILAGSEPDYKSDNRCLRCEHWGLSNHMDVKHILHNMEAAAVE